MSETAQDITQVRELVQVHPEYGAPLMPAGAEDDRVHNVELVFDAMAATRQAIGEAQQQNRDSRLRTAKRREELTDRGKDTLAEYGHKTEDIERRLEMMKAHPAAFEKQGQASYMAWQQQLADRRSLGKGLEALDQLMQGYVTALNPMYEDMAAKKDRQNEIDSELDTLDHEIAVALDDRTTAEIEDRKAQADLAAARQAQDEADESIRQDLDASTIELEKRWHEQGDAAAHNELMTLLETTGGAQQLPDSWRNLLPEQAVANQTATEKAANLHQAERHYEDLYARGEQLRVEQKLLDEVIDTLEKDIKELTARYGSTARYINQYVLPLLEQQAKIEYEHSRRDDQMIQLAGSALAALLSQDSTEADRELEIASEGYPNIREEQQEMRAHVEAIIRLAGEQGYMLQTGDRADSAELVATVTELRPQEITPETPDDDVSPRHVLEVHVPVVREAQGLRG